MFPYEIQEVINWNIYCAATTRINALMEDDEDRCQASSTSLPDNIWSNIGGIMHNRFEYGYEIESKMKIKQKRYVYLDNALSTSSAIFLFLYYHFR
ncbi:hypothetical protein DERP_012721 [Dermatophagoides pteronyssinus]|uniref:Uncharacterized protein n=1 Tax=Dermatophagoides pteronyssinus TaxID=6956 RepID=A0ABQ8JQR0_DERPT|nr:hypothetical protein DERP_012721 [Dermatophagoides pteronyssinus]